MSRITKVGATPGATWTVYILASLNKVDTKVKICLIDGRMVETTLGWPDHVHPKSSVVIMHCSGAVRSRQFDACIVLSQSPLSIKT